MQNLMVFVRILFLLVVPLVAMEAGQFLTASIKVPLAVVSALIVYFSGTWLSDSPAFQKHFLQPFGRFFLVFVLILMELIITRPIFYAFHGHPFVEFMSVGRIWAIAVLTFFLAFLASISLYQITFTEDQISAEDICGDMVGDFWWGILLTIAMAFLP